MAEKQGFLIKEGGNVKNWKKRWCVLKGGALYYYKSQNSKELGCVHIGRASDVKVSDARPNKKYCFEIVTAERIYYFLAETGPERDSWIAEILSEKQRFKDQRISSLNDVKKSPSPTESAPRPTSEVQPAKASLEDFEMLTTIGKGNFGKVVQVKKKENGKIYAMKILDKKTIIENDELKNTKAEKQILQRLCHPFLVNLNYTFQTPDKLYFVMDYVNGGELFYHLQKEKKFTEARTKFYIAEIVCGLEYLHNNGIIYRDMKPENILLSSDGHVCMTDFGISKELNSPDDRTSTFCGTPEYLAPEVLEGKPYGKAVDWWSLGTLMYEMLTGLPPFYAKDVQKMYQLIMTGKLVIPKGITEEAKSLIQGLLTRDPDARITDPKAIKAHAWFRGIDWDLLVAKDIKPPFVPPVKGDADTSQIDQMFTQERPDIDPEDISCLTDADQEGFSGFSYVAPSALS